MKKMLLSLLLLCITLLLTYKSQANTMTIIAHRGASHDAIEHSFSAYDLALQQGADYLELDVQMTQDGVLIIEHDEIPTYGDGRKIQDYTYKEIQSYHRVSKLGTTPILTLQQVLTRYPSTPLYIETKNRRDGIEQKLIHQLQEQHRLEDIDSLIFQSFSKTSLLTIKSLVQEAQLYQLFSKENTKQLTQEKLQEISTYATGIILNKNAVEKKTVKQAHTTGLVVHLYTVDEPSEMKYFQRLGVDGIITNRPDVLYSIIY